ncbi:Transcription antitermination factor NusG [Chryseolinea serpens]|uniref:Transcription antitermination factor NusG n=1 Tax=Chryseolinea serpens TaxID=947013 RepID=A0A1M5XU09_9BACT|nr:UpxY family transcription antiterminator [Chryseolinea serpens]SHI03290.1 Transcription antitermination factor NusG [Chryseolinea serpens]
METTASKCDWHVVYTYPQCEKKAFDKLAAKNIDAYLPCQTVVRQWSDRKKKMDVPLFPNYVFVSVNPKARHEVLNVPGITRFVSFDGQPAILSDREITTIKMMLEGNGDLTCESFYAVGDRVRVISGPLRGLEGMLLEKKGAHRFYVRFHSFEQALSIEIQANRLEKITSH